MKPKQSFKTYYNGNAEFRERHKANMREKKYCECCQKHISTANFQVHLKTQKHNLKINKLAQIQQIIEQYNKEHQNDKIILEIKNNI